MKTGRRCFFLLILCAFSHGAQCSETLAQAITRIYGSPQDRMNYDIWLRGEMLENHRTASVASNHFLTRRLMHCVFAITQTISPLKYVRQTPLPVINSLRRTLP